ncbi:MAG: NAD(P)-dependent alcohol dehydrogenase [Thioalkalivibrio sp.]|nr:NAD(P)-dependent alcohol dehydrogenase [Thioalkalivibrio sp.]
MIHAYAAFEPGGELRPFEYDPGPLGVGEVEIEVEHCGICHSDVSMLDNAWGISSYPLVPGHEVVGRIGAIGPGVTGLEPGQRVGLGWQAGYCMHCDTCMSGDHNLCGEAQGTIIGHHGGFADRVRAAAASVVPLPEGIDAASAGPLFCGGITVFNPLVQYEVPPTARVGVVGIGGLGHLALKFLNAWGCEVTAFTTSESKREAALRLGAHDTLDSRDAKVLEAAAGHFDLILSTVNVKLDWNAYLGTLKPRGRLHFVGATLEPIDVAVFPLLAGQRSISASPVGSPATIRRMLEFAVRHGIAPVTEHFPLERVNDAIDHLRSGQARYRVVLNR